MLKIIRQFAISSLLVILLLPISLFAASSEFRNLDVKIDVLPDARVFEANIKGVHIVGADVGPIDGVPLVLINGYSSNFPYLAPFIKKLNERNFRVFVYNPPGQGRGDIESGPETDESLLGINGMLVAARAVVDYAFEMSGGHKVVLAGHSLGGVQARLTTLGVIGSENGKSRISERRQKEVHDQVGLVVSLFSPPLYAIEQSLSIKKNEITALSIIMPFLLKQQEWWTENFPKLTQASSATQSLIMYNYIKIRQNDELRGLFGAPNLDRAAFSEIHQYFSFTNIKIADQIAIDMRRWATNKTVDTADGFDLVKAWSAQQLSDKRIPTYYLIGEYDNLVPMKWAQGEARIFGSEIWTMSTGHVGAFFDLHLTDAMADAIVDKYMQVFDCKELLSSPVR